MAVRIAPSLSSGSCMTIVITLLHGTRPVRIARDYDYSDWDDLKKALREKLAPEAVTFRLGHWPGKNSHFVRMLSERDVRAEIERGMENVQFLIAHSHGGN